jgi:hypothetical protein
MKKLTRWIILALTPFMLVAQTGNVEFIQYESHLDTFLTDANDFFIFHGDIVNHSESTLSLTVTRMTHDVTEAWSVSFCVGLACLPPFLDIYQFDLEAGDTALFTLDIYPLDNSGYGNWSMFVVDSNSMEVDSANFELQLNPSAIDDLQSPQDFYLSQVYPNPTNAMFSFSLVSPVASSSRVALYDINGRMVRTLTYDIVAGHNQLQMDVSSIPSGSYFLRASASQATQTRKVSIVK